MTRATRAKGAFVGLLMIAFGVTMVLLAMGIVGRTGASALCQEARACEQGCANGRAADCRQASSVVTGNPGQSFDLTPAGIEPPRDPDIIIHRPRV